MVRSARLWFFFLTVLPLFACGGGDDGFAVISVAPTNVPFGVPWSYAIATKDAAGPLSFQLLAGPDGMEASDEGVVTWLPEASDLGYHVVALQVSDGATVLSHGFAVRVHQGTHMGVTLSWRRHTGSFEEQDLVDFFLGSRPYGRLIAAHVPWRDDVALAGQIPYLANAHAQAAAYAGVYPVFGFGWTDGEGVPDLTSESDPFDNTWNNQETRQEFLNMVALFVATYRPPYLFLGNETNLYFHQPGADWGAWLDTFDQAYQTVKSISPNTFVFTTFQLEAMKGGGAANGWSFTPHFGLLDDHARIDGIGFTSFPHFDFANPAALPADYYTEISSYWSGPVVFTEIAWPASPNAPYPGGTSDQADFVPRFFDLCVGLDLEYVVWLFLHDWDGQDSTPAFTDVGLRNNDGTVVRPADQAWRDATRLRQW